MAFDTQYPNRKDWRRPYRDSRRFARSCRNHGSCPWCQRKRTFATVRRQPADMQLQINKVSRDAEWEEIEAPSRTHEA